MCQYADYLKTAINEFAFASELNSILDQYLDPIIPETPLIPVSLTDNIKAQIVSAADSKVNDVKNEIITVIDSIQCSGRRLEVVEVDQYGQQRMLQNDLTFDFLAEELLKFAGVVRSTIFSVSVV